MSLNIEGSAAENAFGGVDYAHPSTAGTGASGASGSQSGRSFRPALWPTLAAALLIPLFLAAGSWQWNKAALKAERQQQLESRGAQGALSIPKTRADAETLNYRKVVAEGRYEPQFQILIDNRTHNGQAGYHVVTPLRIEGSDVRLLVNRGWIPAPGERRETPTVDTPADTLRIRGTAVVPPSRFFSLGSGHESANPEWQGVWQNLDLERYAKAVDFPIQPVVLQLDPPDATGDAGGGFIREWRRPDERRFVNVGYAMQWWAFAATTFALWLVLSFRRSTPKPQQG